MTLRPLALALLIALPAAAGDAPAIPPPGGRIGAVSRTRPRMLLTPESVKELRKRCRSDPESERLFRFMMKRLDGMLGMRPALDNNGRHYLPSYALAYQVTGETKYAEMAGRWLDRMADETIENPWTCLEYVPVGAFAFDWIHDTLSPEQRRRAARGLLRQLARVKKLWRHSDYNNHFLLEHMSQLHVALALAHEPGFEEEAAKLFREAEVWLKVHVLPAANEMAGGEHGEEAGGHAEGFSYDNWGYARPLGRLLAAWESATGEDLFPACVQFRHDAVWNAYGRLPDGTMVRSEDCPSGLRWGEDTRSSFELAAREYRDGVAAGLARGIEAKYPQVVWPTLIFHDPAVKPVALPTLPLARRFRGIGHVYSRSAWDDPDAVVATFQCGPYFAGHQHLDNNAFTIFFRDRLAIDSGVNEYSSHRANYYSRSVAHNTITVLDPEETYPKEVWSDRGEGGSNDGGQRRVPFPGRATASAAEKAVREVGAIVRFEANERWCYAVGDAARSYRPGKVRAFRRHFVHLYPNLVVILDEVETGRASFETRWLLHTIGKPEVSAGLFRATAGGGGLLCFPLLPEADDREVRVVGGPGREYLAGGTNYPPDEKTDPKAGAWRIEVVDGRERTRHVFLHALVAVPADEVEAEAKRWTFEVGSGRSGPGALLTIRRRSGGGRPAVRHVLRRGREGLLSVE